MPYNVVQSNDIQYELQYNRIDWHTIQYIIDIGCQHIIWINYYRA